jgi:hypothetical protein
LASTLSSSFILYCGGDLVTTSTARSKRFQVSDACPGSSDLAFGLCAMPTASDEKAKDLYQSIMTEVMIRSYSINAATKTPTGIPQPLIREYCFLQLRMLCELIAIGCLVAHGDITQTKYFQKAYKADDILKRLEELHPNFYPHPFKATIRQASPGDPGEIKMEDVDTDYLKKDELIKLYARCGSVLHKGNLRKLLAINMTPNDDAYEEIGVWGQKLLNLLSAHKISRVGNRLHFLAFLNLVAPGSNQATITVAIAESPPEK